jgi:hypothetical protein
MPSLDIALIFPNQKIGIQLDGEIHRGFKSIIDEDQAIVLNAKWGKLLRFIKDEDDRIWNGTSDDCFEQFREKIEPIFKEKNWI